MEPKEKAKDFLKIASQFKLGSLVTELPNEATRNLSELAQNNLDEAIAVLKDLDTNTLEVLGKKKNEIFHLKHIIKDTLASGNNIYFCGCGATGRLSLTIETLWRQIHKNDDLENRVFSFMAGGDVALIRSIENFEDYPGFGARQLMESGFHNGDLLVGTTEGGETPFVIGAVEKASSESYRKPFFLYCNPDDVLSEVAERSKLVIENTGIEKINLTVGPMAVTGSTRMQASTILLAAAGIALINYDEGDTITGDSIDELVSFWKSLNTGFIKDFIIAETDCYLKGEYILYETDTNLGITVITDTTERSPTFSLLPFENAKEKDEDLSLCYLYLPYSEDSEKAWRDLLWRAPRTLEWDDINGIASYNRLTGFDFSANVKNRREKVKSNAIHHMFKVLSEKEGIRLSTGNSDHLIVIPFQSPLLRHLVLKMILNAHSTLIMGRLGRYEGNVMTWVRASNNKLIDRAIRYMDLLLGYKGLKLSYEELCYALYENLDNLGPDRAVVLETVSDIVRRRRK